MTMHTSINTNKNLTRSVFSCLRLYATSGLTLLTLAACGGGGGGGSVASAPPTLTSISPVGFVASSTPRTIIMTGSNFISGMTLSISGTGITTVNIPNPTISSDGMTISASVTINTAPTTDRYVTVTLKSSVGTTLGITILGIALNDRTMAGNIQAIFDSNCIACHSTSGSGGLNLTNGSSVAALVNTNSMGCTSKYRVTPGDPRRSSSVLVDKIKVASTGTAACAGTQMPPSVTIATQDLADIIDWIAGGVR